MADNLSTAVEELRGSKVRLLGVGERAGLHVLELHADVEGHVSSNGGHVLGEGELGGRHVGGGWDGTDGHGIAGASGDLETVGEGNLRQGLGAEVDVVVLRGRRSSLA